MSQRTVPLARRIVRGTCGSRRFRPLWSKRFSPAYGSGAHTRAARLAAASVMLKAARTRIPRRYRRKQGQAVVLRHQERMPREYRRARRLRGTSSVDGARCALSKIAPRQTAIRISIVEAHPALAVTCHTPLRDEDLGPAIPVAKVIGAVAGTLAENPLRVALIDFPLLVTDAGRSIADDVRARA